MPSVSQLRPCAGRRLPVAFVSNAVNGLLPTSLAALCVGTATTSSAPPSPDPIGELTEWRDGRPEVSAPGQRSCRRGWTVCQEGAGGKIIGILEDIESDFSNHLAKETETEEMAQTEYEKATQ